MGAWFISWGSMQIPDSFPFGGKAGVDSVMGC